MISSLAWKATFSRINAQRHWTQWDQFSDLPSQKQRDFIGQGLVETLRYFGGRSDAFPEWGQLSAGGNSEDVWEHWSELPIVTKKDIQERFDPEELMQRFGVQGQINTSGGSTGAPTRFVWDRAAQEQKAALQYYCWQKLGWNAGMAVMSIWGSPRDLGQAEGRRTRLSRRLHDVTIIDGYEFSQRTVDEAEAAITSRKHIAVYGYTTLLEQFAREILESDRRTPVGNIVTAWSGAEPLRTDQSELFRQAFGVPIHNQYGGREFGAIAYKLDGQSSFNLFRPVLFLEIVNDQNEPCAPGEIGRILLTTLIGRGTPFIRYENGDLGTYAERDMTEAGLVGMTSIDGRTTSLIHLPDGRTFHSVFWHQLFKDYSEIKGFHVHQRDDGSIQIIYVGRPLSPETSVALDRLIGRMLGGVAFSVSHAEVLPKTSQGKHIQVTSDYHPSR